MKPTELAIALATAFKLRTPLLITGAPGVGKSKIVETAAQTAKADLILSHPAVADPTDAKGLPWVVDGHATFLPFGELERAVTAKRPTVWFLDDLGQATPAVQTSYMQLLLARRVNGHILPDCVTFVAATNRRTDRSGVTGILEAVKSRFGSIVSLEADLDDWCNWAIDHDLPAELIAFLRFRPDLLSKFAPTADLTNSPSPRTWQNASQFVNCGVSAELQHQLIAGAVGEGAAVEFSAFLRLYQELPNIDQILIDPTSVKIPTMPAALYAVAGAVALKTTKTNFPRVAQFAQRLHDDGRGEFAVLLLKDSMRRCPDVMHTQAFVKMITSEIGAAINGPRAK